MNIRDKFELLKLFVIIAVLSIGVRLLIKYDFDQSALLYVGIPFLASLLLILIRDFNEPSNWKKQYLNRLIDAFIIMLGSSIVLFEGFLCVVMFMPIYLLFFMVGFTIKAFYEMKKKRTLSIHILPLIVVMSAFEGVSPELSYNRNEQVTVTRIVQSNIPKIKQNLIQPIDLQKERPWFLTIFPMPHEIKAGSLKPGDIHEIHFKYYKWFVTNLHEGRMLLEISDVDDDRIKTTFLGDTSYIAKYLELKGTEIQLEQLDYNRTRITLTIDFKRNLDPYWYFSPMQRYGVSKTAGFLIDEVIAREVSL